MTLKMNHMIVAFLVYIRPPRDICDEFLDRFFCWFMQLVYLVI